MRRSSLILILLWGAFFGSTHVQAQQSGASIKLLVGFSAGGAQDTLARAVADRLRVILNQPIVVENKPGASQRLALSELKRSKPDGFTLMLSNSAPFTMFPHIYKKLEFDPVADFTPIGRVATYSLCIAAGPKAPAGGIKEFVEWAKKNPAQASYGSSGGGTAGHFVGDMLSRATGAPLFHVPYKGGAPAITDLAGGQVPIIADTILESLEMSKGGKVRLLATSGATRTAATPDIPTLKESGIDVIVEAYVGIYAPAGLSKENVQRIGNALRDVMQEADLQKRINQFAMTPAYAPAQDLVQLQAESLKKWEGPIKLSGFTVD